MKRCLVFFTTIVVVFFDCVFANNLSTSTEKNPVPICGTPRLWGKIPEIISVKLLTKPVKGDTTFFIRDDLYASPVSLEEVSFYKKFKNDKIVIYVEVKEFDENRVDSSDIVNVKDAMLYETPSGSVNPHKGILTNEIEIFGELPDIDKNGKLFVLLIDVRDGYEPGDETYVAGYFDPLDQNKSKGNYSDIIYIDTNPANTNDKSTLSVVAHELQHLIHYNYDTDEDTWLNEGLSELAPRILGFPVRSFAPFLHDTNRPLNNFDDSITDYAKVGLWTFYFYKRFGIGMIKPIVEEKANSLQSYEEVLGNSGYTTIKKEDLLRDWFIANMINDSGLEGGKYGYADAVIPEISSKHFSANFTQGEDISDELYDAAAEYIQFYSGKDISFEMTHDIDSQFGIAVLKHFSFPEITIFSPCPNPFNFADSLFGNSYGKITFVPFSTSIKSSPGTTDFTYNASGKGGYEEEEIAYDGDSISFYIDLSNYEAAEKFTLPSDNSRLAAIKFNVNHNSPVTVRVYASLYSSPIEVYNNIIPNAGTWTRFDFDEDILPEFITSFAMSVSSSDNSLGYSHTEEGQGRAYLNVGMGFRDLSEFTTTNDTTLTGDWLIRAIIQKPVVTPAELVIEPDSLYFWNNEYHLSFEIRNSGTEMLSWIIDNDYPNWLDIEPKEGLTLDERDKVIVSIDRKNLSPGIYELSVPITSNGGDDSVFISVLERNYERPQAVLFPFDPFFNDEIGKILLKVFNIGLDEASFKFLTNSSFLAFYPSSGIVPYEDTVYVDAFLDRKAVTECVIPVFFCNNVDTLKMNFTYEGEIHSAEEKLSVLPVVQNPFVISEQSYTTIRIRLISEKRPSLIIYNILGQEIKSFTFENYEPGLHLFQWDGKNDKGHWTSSGVYFIVLRQNGKTARQKMLLLR